MSGTEVQAAAPGAGGEAVAGVPASSGGGAQMGNVLRVSDAMVGLTWLSFLLACLALYKLAWKPICQALDRREDKIRQSLKEAADIQANAAMDREAQRMALEEARREAAGIVERARTAAEVKRSTSSAMLDNVSSRHGGRLVPAANGDGPAAVSASAASPPAWASCSAILPPAA